MLRALGLLSVGVLQIASIVILAVLIGVLWKRRSLVRLPRHLWVPTAAVALVVGVVATQFASVHVSYTGPVSTTTATSYVVDDTYLYPLFSDEWVTLGIATHVLRDGMPFSENPFTGKPYVNVLVAFQSFVTGVLGGSGIAFPTAYVLLAVLIGTLTVGLIGILLASFRVPFGFVLLGMIAVPFVVNGANLPMLWYLLPWNVSFIFLVSTIVLLIERYNRLSLLVGVLAILLYPPMIVFVVPIFCAYLFFNQSRVERKHLLMYGGGAIAAGAVFFTVTLLVSGVPFVRAFEYVSNFIVRPRGESVHMAPPFYVWQVIPIALVPFVFYSFFIEGKKIWYLRTPVVIGLVGWAIFSVSPKFLIIDYYRVVAITALLLVPLGSIAVADVWNRLTQRFPLPYYHQLSIVLVGVLLIVSVVLVPGYATQDRWRQFSVELPSSGTEQLVAEPAAPVNRHLHADDIALFKTLSGERFIAPAWKGLLLGALTNNDPLFTKTSTLTVKTVPYEDFIAADCVKKEEIVKRFHVTYVYGEKINCPGYVSTAVSAEGLHLSRITLAN
jgi:hypothetical protein